MKRIKDVVYAGIVKCLDSVTAPKFIGNLQGTADKARGIEGLTASVDELNHVKGVTNGIQNQIDNLTKAINDATALRASLEAYGMTKVTNSSAVTDSTGLALAATEKNASIDGTLANQISQLNSDMTIRHISSRAVGIVTDDGYGLVTIPYGFTYKSEPSISNLINPTWEDFYGTSDITIHCKNLSSVTFKISHDGMKAGSAILVNVTFDVSGDI